ncbi:alpha/beta hydrolase [Sinomonas sp. ASV486]|uniref:Alpha/beta fold hydrolase n=1 Tax=Sinomonas puerhi TaxID=3238584 RepID=A0AB39L0H0_9MICC|nr:alpha/beta hydrolase [Sinomonas sp. ASV486]MDQ4492085.1 alpha/beta hydrolase [Sinomonas sp. ASV486]
MTETQCKTVPSADGTPIAVWITGSGPTLLAIHGAACDHTAWDRMIPLLAPHMTVAALDRRGRPASGDAEAYDTKREVEDAVAVAAALPGPVHVYGHSFGGLVAVHAAPRIPNLGSLTLYEGSTAPSGVEIIPRAFIDELDRLVTSGLPEEALDLFLPAAARMEPAQIEALKSQSIWHAMLRSAYTIPRELRAVNEHAADPLETDRVAAPVLIVVGEATEPQRRSWYESVAARFADARIAVLAGQGHAANMTAPDLLASALLEFLDRAAVQSAS